MPQLFTNNAVSILASAMAFDATTLTVKAGDGALFPNPLNGDFFKLTLFQLTPQGEVNRSILKISGRNGDDLTISGWEEGSTPRSYNAGDGVEIRATAGAQLPVYNGALTGPLNEAVPVTLASASSMAIGAAASNHIKVTGNVTINAFDAITAGARRSMSFSGTPTITHNAGSMKCIGGASIVVQAGDSCEWRSLGGGNWEMIGYTRASGAALTADATKAGLGANTFTGPQSLTELDKGTVTNGTVTFAYSATNVQRLQVGGALTVALSALPPAGVFGAMLLKLVNAGAFAITFPTIQWIQPSGAPTTSIATYLASIGRSALQAAGTDFVFLWTDDGGATVYGKLV